MEAFPFAGRISKLLAARSPMEMCSLGGKAIERIETQDRAMTDFGQMKNMQTTLRKTCFVEGCTILRSN